MHPRQGAAVGSGAAALPFLMEGMLELRFYLLQIRGLNSAFTLPGTAGGKSQAQTNHEKLQFSIISSKLARLWSVPRIYLF